MQPSDVQVLPDPARRWLPATPAQKAALDSEADILLLGGAAGSLKTSTMLVDMIQERDYPRMRSYFFRRTYKELEGGGGAIDQALQLYPQTGATYNASAHTWRWPSGAELYFRHCQHEKDVYPYQSQAMSAVAIDESTHWPEAMARYLITRNRSTDPGLKIRFRLGTNPGNIGHKWHMKLFFGGVCPHCEPQNAPPAGELRYDARWPSDGVALSDPNGEAISVSYILSYVRDHNLLGQSYISRLRMQNPALAKALLEGCWRQFEGQYFDIWDYNTMVVPVQLIPQNWWQAWWSGSDYGYSGSAAAGTLFTRAEDGMIYLVQEYPSDEKGARRENVRTFARNLYDKFMKLQEGQEQARRFEANFLSPDSWNDRGDNHTLAGQMNEILDEYGLSFIKAHNDRAGGAQLMYSMLQDGQWKIADTCRNTIESMESRIHDEDEPVKVKKVAGDPLDDYFDAARYGLYSYVSTAVKPAELRAADRFNKILQSHGQNKDMALTSAILQHQKILREEMAKDEGQPVYVGSAARRRMLREPRR
ncbi:MAG: hypothetical protein C5B44_05720 [Acidobacteria bacterium]|nr:MAG: hypothetical protein C5B44_05720 [Acidobacteriota bacterium]